MGEEDSLLNHIRVTGVLMDNRQRTGVKKIITWSLRGLVVLILMICAGGCRSRPPAAPSANQVLAVKKVAPDTTQTVVENLEMPPLRVYVDASESMRGFAHSRSSKFCRTLSHVMQKTVSAPYTVSYYKFSEQTQPLNRSQFNLSTTPGFYGGADTPLAELLNRIARDETHSITVIITDLVQSEPGTDRFDLPLAFRTVAENYSEILMIASKSSFRGFYWSEVERGLKFQLNYSSDSLGRPFYILVFAPSKKAMQTFRHYVLTDELTMEYSFAPSDPPLRMKDVRTSAANRKFWTRSKAPEHRNDSNGLETWVTWFRALKWPSTSTCNLELVYQTKQIVPMGTPLQLVFECEQVSLKGCFGDEDILPLNDFNPTVTERCGDSSLTIAYPISRPKPKEWTAYYIRIRPGEGSLRLPEWVDDWSTDDDTNPRNGDLTLHLASSVETMQRNITEKRIILDKYILVVK